MSEPPNIHTASFEFEAGPFRTRASAKISTGGLLATGVAVAVVILAVAPLVWAATSPARRRAEAGRPAERLVHRRSGG